MTSFHWAVLGLIVFGMVLPFWIMTVFTVIAAEKDRRKAKEKRAIYVHDYVELMQSFSHLLKGDDDEKFNGPTMIAYLRELREYPQYRDPTLLFLEEITVTGSGKWDNYCKTELKSIEEFLLGLSSD